METPKLCGSLICDICAFTRKDKFGLTIEEDLDFWYNNNSRVRHDLNIIDYISSEGRQHMGGYDIPEYYFSKGWIDLWADNAFYLRNNIAENMPISRVDPTGYKFPEPRIVYIAYFPIFDFSLLLKKRKEDLLSIKSNLELAKARLNLENTVIHLGGQETGELQLGLEFNPEFITPKSIVNKLEENYKVNKEMATNLEKNLEHLTQNYTNPYMISLRAKDTIILPFKSESEVKITLIGELEYIKPIMDRFFIDRNPKTFSNLFSVGLTCVRYYNHFVKFEDEKLKNSFLNGTYNPFESVKKILVYGYRNNN